MDRCNWRKVIKEARWSGWVWVGECFFWYRPTRVVPDQRPLNGRCCCCCCFSNKASRQACAVQNLICRFIQFQHVTPHFVTLVLLTTRETIQKFTLKSVHTQQMLCWSRSQFRLGNPRYGCACDHRELKCADTVGTVLVLWAGHFQC